MPLKNIGETTLSAKFSDMVSQQDEAICSESIPSVLRLTIICTFAAAAAVSPFSRSLLIGLQWRLNEKTANVILRRNAETMIHAISPR